MNAVTGRNRLETQDREQLISTVRSLLAEADALSSRIAAVNEIGIAINQLLDLDAILQVIGKKAKWLLDFQHCSVCLQDKDSSWRIATLFGAPETLNSLYIADTDNLGGVLKTGQAALVHYGSPSRFLQGYASQIIIPLNIENTVIGTINFASRATHLYTQDDLRIGYMIALQLSGAIRNATQVEQLQAAHLDLRHHAAELEARNQELDAFSHTIAHDLKSPLTSIRLKTEIIKARYGDVLPPKVIEYGEGIYNHVTQMSSMIDQLLWLARLRDASFNLVPVPIAQIVEAVIWRFYEIATQNHITITAMSDLPDAMGHAQWVDAIFGNLVSNAIKYMGESNPDARITIRGERRDECIRYEVCDTGVGISPADQSKLFEMFTRLHTVDAEGLGLGLSIVHRMVSKLNGEVGVESEPGKGSTFWFTLPAIPAIDQAG